MWDGFKSDVLYRHWSGSNCVGCAVVTLKKHQLIFPTNVLDSSSQPIWGLHICLRIDFLPTTMYVRWMIPLQSQKTVRMHISAPGWILNIFFFRALGWANPSKSLFISDRRDEPNSLYLLQCCTENNYPCFRSKRVIADTLPLLLSSFRA